MKKRMLAVLLAGVMTLGLAACGGSGSDSKADSKDSGSSDGDIKLAVLLKPESNEYWASMKAGIEDWAKDQDGVSVDVYCAESEDNIQGQLEQMENIISKDYDAICAAPLSASNLVEGVLKACDAGIPVVNVDEGIDADAVKEGGGNMVGMYTTDNVLVGQKAAEYITEQIGSGEVAIIEGTAGNVTSNDRTKGATDYFESQDGMKVVASQPGDWDRLTSIDVATNIMQSNPDLKAFYCANDTMALGVYEAVVNAGKQDQVMVVGTDAIANAKESVKNGEMAATVGQDNVGIGVACCELAVKAVKDGWKADPSAEMPVEYIDSFLVTKDNVDDYL